MTSQAGRIGVCPGQPIAGFLLVVEREVISNGVPAVCDVAKPTSAGKSAMRHKRTPPAAPALARQLAVAI